jgi:hypothetical protein
MEGCHHATPRDHNSGFRGAYGGTVVGSMCVCDCLLRVVFLPPDRRRNDTEATHGNGHGNRERSSHNHKTRRAPQSGSATDQATAEPRARSCTSSLLFVLLSTMVVVTYRPGYSEGGKGAKETRRLRRLTGAGPCGIRSELMDQYRQMSIGRPSQRSISRLWRSAKGSRGNSPCHFPIFGSQAEQTGTVSRQRATQ